MQEPELFVFVFLIGVSFFQNAYVLPEPKPEPKPAAEPEPAAKPDDVEVG